MAHWRERLQAGGTGVLRFVRDVSRRFVDQEISLAASSLTYTSLLSLVPFMSVLVTVFSAMPLFDDIFQTLQDFIFQNFVPATGEVLQTHITDFVARARGLTVSMSLIVFVTSILMIHTMEKALNKIFGSQSPKPLLKKITIYWAVLTLGPLLVGGGFALTSFVLQYSALQDVRTALLKGLPVITSALGFFIIYLLVPNSRVRWKSALLGALVAATLFEISKRIFVWYVSTFPGYQQVYGALATIPLFLIWLYVSWNIVLLGAVLAAALDSSRWRAKVQGYDPVMRLLVVLNVLRLLRQQRKHARTVSHADLQSAMPSVPDDELDDLLEWLEAKNIVERNREGEYLLLQDLRSLTFRRLYRAGQFALPMEGGDEYREFAPLLQRIDSAMKELNEQSIEQILSEVKS